MPPNIHWTKIVRKNMPLLICPQRLHAHKLVLDMPLNFTAKALCTVVSTDTLRIDALLLSLDHHHGHRGLFALFTRSCHDHRLTTTAISRLRLTELNVLIHANSVLKYYDHIIVSALPSLSLQLKPSISTIDS